MYRVLLPVDANEPRARAQVEAVCELPTAPENVSVDVLHVHEDVTASDGDWAAGGFADAYAEEMEDTVGDLQSVPGSVERAAEILESNGIEHAVHEMRGEPAEAILAIAEEYDSDVIVVGVGTQSPVGKVLFGSVVQAVILASDRPVLTVPAN